MVGRVEKWQDWRRDVFGDPYLVWHDGPDFARLLTVAGEEPEDVARMLGTGIAKGDSLAAESIAALAGAGLAPSGAEALLRAALPGAAGTFLVRVAQALHVLTSDERWAEQVVSALAEGAHWTDRIDAAIALAGFAPTPRLVDALAEAVQDHHYLVRYHAANSLLRYAGRRRAVSDDPALFALIRSGNDNAEPDAETAQRYAEAARRLSAAALSRQSVDPDRS